MQVEQWPPGVEPEARVKRYGVRVQTAERHPRLRPGPQVREHGTAAAAPVRDRVYEEVAQHADGLGAGADLPHRAESGYLPAELGDHDPAMADQVANVGRIAATFLIVLTGGNRDGSDRGQIGLGSRPHADFRHKGSFVDFAHF